jgi:hypothetical protein
MPRRHADDSTPSRADPPSPSRTEIVLKWIGRATALLAFVFAVIQFVKVVSDVRERRRQIDELVRTEQLQAQANDYPAAWASLDRALTIAESGGQLAKLTGQLSVDARRIREAQENLAMAWVEDLRVAPGGTYMATADKLTPVMTRGAVAASGARKADLLAHIGWATFYKSLEGAPTPDLTPQYQAALAVDSTNPFAHAFLGHWIVWSRGSLESAMKEFDAAVAANRSRPFVRMVQRHAFKRRGQSADGTLIAMVNEMRRNGETIGPTIASDVESVYYFNCGTSEKKDDMRVILNAVPPADQIVTYRALFYDASGKSTDASRAPGRNACLALLLEAAGQKEEALSVWREVRQEFKPKDLSQLADRADAAIRRLSAR